MRLLRGLLGAVLWILAVVVGLLGVILSVTVILLPLGIPLIWLSRRLFGACAKLFLPRRVRHPVQESVTSAKSRMGRARNRGKRLEKSLPSFDLGAAKKKSRKLLRRRRKKLSLAR